MEEDRLKVQQQQQPDLITTMDIDMEEEEVGQNKSTPHLLGFFYNMSYNSYGMVSLPQSVCENAPPKIRYRNPVQELGDCAYAVLNSSNGMVLFYVSTFLKKSYSCFTVQDPLTSDFVGVPITPHINLASPKRFLVYGFVFNPHSPRLSFNIVEISDTSSLRPGSLLISKFCSLESQWKTKVHVGNDLVPLLGENFVLSGMSTYLHGAFHWLLEPSGIIGYNLEADCFKLSLINIPGDMLHVNEFGLCNCITRSTKNKTNNKSAKTSPTRSVCNCRYLGECRDRLVYARVTGDSEFSVWILEDYHAALWSNCHRVRVDHLETSLFGGRVLAFSRSNAHLVFLRVERRIFSYDYMTGELEQVGIMEKKYKGDDKWDGFVFPFELPIVPAFIRKDGLSRRGFPQLNPDGPAANTTNSVQSNGNQNCCYHHYAVTQLAKMVLDNHPQEHDLNTMEGELPFRSSVFLYGPAKAGTKIDAKDRFSELIRLEAALYGSIGRLLSGDDSQVISRQLVQTLQLS